MTLILSIWFTKQGLFRQGISLAIKIPRPDGYFSREAPVMVTFAEVVAGDCRIGLVQGIDAIVAAVQPIPLDKSAVEIVVERTVEEYTGVSAVDSGTGL